MIIVSALRFILSLCIPMLEVMLHTIIDEVRVQNMRVFKVGEEIDGDKMWKKESFWVMISRIWLPTAYLFAALGILVPGIINTISSG